MRPQREKKSAKKAPEEPEDDVTGGLGGMGLNDDHDPKSDSLLGSGKEDKDSDEDEEVVPLSGPGKAVKVPRKQTSGKTPARSTPADDRLVCTQWYVHFLGVKDAAAEYLYDLEDLTKPFKWVKLTEKAISVIVKGCRDQNIHVSATAIGKMALLAFLCMHHERIQQPLLDMTSINEDMLDDIERQKKLEDHYKDEKPTSDPPTAEFAP